MAQLRQDYAQFVERQTEIVVVGPDSPGAFANYWKSNNLPFIGLPDSKASVLKLYGQEVSLFKLGRMPAQVLVDRDGIARFVHYMSDIPENSEIFALLDEMESEPA